MKAVCFLFALWCCYVGRVSAADTIAVAAIDGYIALEKHQSVQVMPASAASNWQEAALSKAWLPVDSQWLSRGQKDIWLRFVLHNNSSKSQYLYITHGSSDSFVLTVQYPDTVLQLFSGDYINSSGLQFDDDNNSNGFSLAAGVTATVYAKVYNEHAHLYFHSFYLETPAYYDASLVTAYAEDSPPALYHAVVMGCLVFSLFFMSFLGWWFKEKSFMYYVMYIAGALLYLLPKTNSTYSYAGKLVFHVMPYYLQVSEGLQYVFYAAYVAFGASLVNAFAYRRLSVYIKTVIAVFLLYAASITVYQFATHTYLLPNSGFVLIRLLSYVLCIVAVVWIVLQVKSPLKKFFMLASVIFIAFTAWAAVSNLYRSVDSKPFFYITPMVALKTAVLLDSIVFAAALGYKMYLTEKEKRRHFQSYIQQLEVNEQLVRNMNVQLEQTVAERTAELEAQKEKQLRLEYERQLAQLEMQSLRSQMNPHFIFNSLNSIRYQIQTAQYKNASDYLMRFSKLLRLTLENSRRETVTLAEELALTQLYLDIEGQRFGDTYRYHIEVAANIDTDDILLPPLLLQPFAENAIKHGLMNSNKLEKMVRISVSELLGGCCICIEDNGVGRQASQQRKQEGGLEHQSLGMNITMERMRLFGLHEHVLLTFHIEDIVVDEHIDGTRVVITCKQPTHV